MISGEPVSNEDQLSDSLHASCPDLPPELILAIIEEVYSSVNTDKASQATLAACALACRQWNACAQPFYFRDIHISSERHLEGFLALLGCSPWIGGAVMTLTLVDPDTLWTSRYRTVPSERVTSHPPLSFVDSEAYDSCSDSFRRALFHIFPSKLQALRTIKLGGYTDPGKHLTSDSLQSLSRLTGVRKVVFDSCPIASIVIQSIACSLPGLQELQLIDNQKVDDLCPESFYNDLKTVADSQPRLTTLRGYAGPFNRNGITFQWIIDSPSRYTLRSLSIMFEVDSPEPFGPLLREVGPYLEHLSFEIEGTPKTHWISTDRYKEYIDLSPLTNLKSLVIRANVRTELLYHFLPQISSLSLSLIVIVMANVHWYISYLQKHSFSDLLMQLPCLQSDCTRIVFANDPIDPSKLVGDVLESEEETAGIQTVEVLKTYLDKELSASPSSLQYEVMSFSEASALATARPIDM